MCETESERKVTMPSACYFVSLVVRWSAVTVHAEVFVCPVSTGGGMTGELCAATRKALAPSSR